GLRQLSQHTATSVAEQAGSGPAAVNRRRIWRPRRLVLDRLLDAIDDQHRDWPALRVELQPELLLHRREDRRAVRINRHVGSARPAAIASSTEADSARRTIRARPTPVPEPPRRPWR